MADGARETAETVARAAYGRLLAYLSARSRDVAAAEDALAEAFRAALETWPARGVPDRPEAWLFTVGPPQPDPCRPPRRRSGRAAEPTLALLAEERQRSRARASPTSG